MEDTNSTSMPLQAGQLWRELSQEIRKPFDMQAKLLKADYDKKMTLFKAQGGVVTRKRPSGEDSKDSKPRRPTGGGYGCFLAAKRPEIAKTLPEGSKITDVSKAAGEMWRGLTASEKKPYEEEFLKRLAEYQEAKEAYDAAKQGTIDLLELAMPSKKAIKAGA
ncbi:unnamed protein product [Durusdinium trenchii]|uniref:HMG box domain-containing protein n=1 Tax=Durusdinium trenchii TaxID=1381693 RepID=A0ABP0JAW0_9DINO